jgi:DNA-binding transcriptional LysR family regulator
MTRISDLDLNGLMIFHTVVEQGSIQKAKDILGRTQPAITLRLNKLEDDLGKKLFLQKKPNLKLTVEGEALYRWTTALKKHVERSPMARSGGLSTFQYPLRIGTYTHVSAFCLPGAIRKTSEKFKNLLFNTSFDDPYDLFQKLRSGALDVIILPKHFNPSGDIQKVFSVAQKYVAVIPDAFGTRDLVKAKWCYYQNPKDQLLQALNNILREHVERPDVRWEISKLTSSIHAAEAQLAAAIVPSFLLCRPVQECQIVPLTSKLTKEIPLEAYIRTDFATRPTAKALEFFCDSLGQDLQDANDYVMSFAGASSKSDSKKPAQDHAQLSV